MLEAFSQKQIDGFKDWIRKHPDESTARLSESLGISKQYVRVLRSQVKSEDTAEPDLEELVAIDGVKKALEIQRLRDVQRVERASFRKEARKLNTANEMLEGLLDIIGEMQVTPRPQIVPTTTGGTLLLQITDAHIGSSIALPDNVVDTKVLSRRLYKYAETAVRVGLKQGVRRCVVALTGDCTSSDRRESEMAASEYNRSHAVLNAFEIISGLIDYISSFIPVTHICSVLGNEPRVSKELALEHKIYYHNFDFILDRMLAAYFTNIKVIDMINPVERILNIDGLDVLMTHGLVKPKASPSDQLSFYRQRYGKIDLIICGHIHSPLVAPGFSRSGGLPGANGYSTYFLGIPNSLPSQTFHIIEGGQSFSFPIDLSSVGEEYFRFTEVPDDKTVTTTRVEV